MALLKPVRWRYINDKHSCKFQPNFSVSIRWIRTFYTEPLSTLVLASAVLIRAAESGAHPAQPEILANIESIDAQVLLIWTVYLSIYNKFVGLPEL